MRIDLVYIATVLDVFLDSDKAHVKITDIQNAGVNIEGEGDSFCEKFMFHMQILIDNQLIGLMNGPAFNLKDIGINLYPSGNGMLVIKPIRLTQNGHDFACSLNNKEVLFKLKTELKDAPFKVIFEGGQKLLQHFMKKKLDALLE